MNDAVIAANNIVKTYKNVKALDGISMEMKRGEILAFLWPNGAGKTSAVNIFTGLLRQDSGEIYYNGRPFNPLNPAQKRMIGVVPQRIKGNTPYLHNSCIYSVFRLALFNILWFLAHFYSSLNFVVACLSLKSTSRY